ncbi:ATP-dependent RecD-like DNA helicase [Streptomyces stramineus]
MSNTDRYTTHDILAAEQVIVDQARARYADGSARLTGDQAAAALSVFQVAAGFELSAEQRRVVERLLTAGHGVDAVFGVAGSGKTTLMEACRIGWDAVGMTYAGACLSAVAAQNLYEGSGVPSSTIASWLKRIEAGTGLRGVDVLVLDEAVMTDDRAMAVLLAEAARTGTKIIAIGDPQQLQAIGPGGGFEEVHRLVGGEFLADNRRQKDEGERAALEVWRQGAAQRERALRMLSDGGRVHATDTADAARAEILAAWNQIRTRWPDAHDALANLVVLAARNEDVDSLNAGAQALRRAAGELGPARTFVLPRRETLTLAVGDVVRVRRNDYRSRRGAGLDVLNGYRAVVTDISDDRRVQITWRREESDGTVSHQQAWLTPGQISQGALSLGYAMTIAASQGLTAQTSLMYGLGANSFSLYPGITRAKGENHLWLPAAALEDEETRATLGEPRSEAELLDRALYAYGALLKQDRPAQMVSDQLRAAPDPVAPPAPAPEPEFPAWDDTVARPYGALSDAVLDTKIAKAEQQATAAGRAAADKARELESAAAELTAHVSPGKRIADEAGALLAEADRLLDLAQQETANADRAAPRGTGPGRCVRRQRRPRGAPGSGCAPPARPAAPSSSCSRSTPSRWRPRTRSSSAPARLPRPPSARRGRPSPALPTPEFSGHRAPPVPRPANSTRCRSGSPRCASLCRFSRSRSTRSAPRTSSMPAAGRADFAPGPRRCGRPPPRCVRSGSCASRSQHRPQDRTRRSTTLARWSGRRPPCGNGWRSAEPAGPRTGPPARFVRPEGHLSAVRRALRQTARQPPGRRVWHHWSRR